MNILAVFLALAALTSGFKIGTKNVQLIKVVNDKSKQCGPDETQCPGGCCPGGPNWYCCPGDWFPDPGDWCAATADDCPFEALRKTHQQLVKLAKKSSQHWCDGPNETLCPNGFCCPEANWVCCPEFWCAPTLADCS